MNATARATWAAIADGDTLGLRLREDTVTYADLMTAPDGATAVAADRIAEILARYEKDSAVHRAVVASSPLLLAAARRVEDRLISAGAHPR